MNKSIVATLSVIMTACSLSEDSVADMPLVYEKECTVDSFPDIELPSLDSLPVITYLPDPFLWADGSGRSTDFNDWERHRAEILRRLWHYELGDESGYVSANAAREVWKTFGISERMGYSIESNHMHCMLPESQYPDVEAFIKRYLLGEDSINTDITKAPMFADVDWRKWVPWAEERGLSSEIVCRID